jgi:hypothetical protein
MKEAARLALTHLPEHTGHPDRDKSRKLADGAFARGDGPAFTAAMKELDRRLRLYPQLGDQLLDLAEGGGQIRVDVIRPLCMR